MKVMRGKTGVRGLLLAALALAASSLVGPRAVGSTMSLNGMVVTSHPHDLENSIPYLPGTDLVLERGFPEATRTALTEKGHRLAEPAARLGMLNAIKIFPASGVLSGGADARREGQVAAW